MRRTREDWGGLERTKEDWGSLEWGGSGAEPVQRGEVKGSSLSLLSLSQCLQHSRECDANAS